MFLLQIFTYKIKKYIKIKKFHIHNSFNYNLKFFNFNRIKVLFNKNLIAVVRILLYITDIANRHQVLRLAVVLDNTCDILY